MWPDRTNGTDGNGENKVPFREIVVGLFTPLIVLGSYYGWPDRRMEILFPVTVILLLSCTITFWDQLEEYVRKVRGNSEEARAKRGALGITSLCMGSTFLQLSLGSLEDEYARHRFEMYSRKVGLYATIALGLFLLLLFLVPRAITLIRKSSSQPTE